MLALLLLNLHLWNKEDFILLVKVGTSVEAGKSNKKSHKNKKKMNERDSLLKTAHIESK